jgi:hypothetical protein
MMTALRRRGSLLAASLLVLLATACNPEQAAAPSAVAPSASSTLAAPTADSAAQDLLGLGGLVGTLTNALGLTNANGVLRKTPLASNITVRKTIGRSGGVLSIPAAGVTVVVPAGALNGDTQITMTARAGYLLAYDFDPHGVKFNVPLVFNQSLNNTNVGLLTPLSLKLGYYTDPSLLGKTTALVAEVVQGVVSILTRTFTAPIKHFSGYVVMTGRVDQE